MRYIFIYTRNMLVILLISSLLSCGASITHHTLDSQPIRESGPFQSPTQLNSEINSDVVHKHESQLHSSYTTNRIIFWAAITTTSDLYTHEKVTTTLSTLTHNVQ